MKEITQILIISLLLNCIIPKKSDEFLNLGPRIMSFADDADNLSADGFASQNGGTTGGKGGIVCGVKL